jgi:urea carboxylase-associated protein 2
MVDEHDPSGAGTGTLAGARDHARRQAVTTPSPVASKSTVTSPDGADGEIVWSQVIGGGDYAACRLPLGAVLRITDVDGGGCTQLLVHNARQPAERLNVADTVKVQWQAYLGVGAQLLSDMGRVMMTIVADTSEHHDCLCGCTTFAANTARYGGGSASGPTPNGRDLLALGVAKLGLSRLDVGPNVNLFTAVRVDEAGALHLAPALRPGAYVELRADMDVFVTLANTPHPLDDRPVYTSTPVECVAWLPAGAGPPTVPATPERQRAVQNTDAFLLGFR